MDTKDLIARAREVERGVTPGDWVSVLGSGEHQCTAIIAEFEPPRASIFIADLLPDWALSEMVVPEDHVPNLKFIEASHTLVPALADALEQATAELAALREAARWVKVGDRLPTPEQSVLMSNGNAVETGCYFAGNWWQNGSKVRVTHWRPLPTPPDEEA